MHIRPALPIDDLTIAQIHTLAFGRSQEAQLVARIRASNRYLPQLSLVADLGEAIVGHILLSWVDLVGETTLPVLALAPLAVKPEFQRQGMGSALVRSGLTAAAATTSPLVVVLGNPQFYTQFGFEPSINEGIHSPFAVPADAFMVKLLQPNAKQFAGTIVYPSAFQGV
jgi:putative acetyltransferase